MNLSMHYDEEILNREDLEFEDKFNILYNKYYNQIEGQAQRFLINLEVAEGLRPFKVEKKKKDKHKERFCMKKHIVHKSVSLEKEIGREGETAFCIKDILKDPTDVHKHIENRVDKISGHNYLADIVIQMIGEGYNNREIREELKLPEGEFYGVLKKIKKSNMHLVEVRE